MDAKLETAHVDNLFRVVKTTMHFYKHDVTKIRYNGLIHFVCKNSAVVFLMAWNDYV
jgi:hypothetical protein